MPVPVVLSGPAPAPAQAPASVQSSAAVATVFAPEPRPAAGPALAVTPPAAHPFGRSPDLVDPPDFVLEPESPADRGTPARDRYPHQALRERVSQLARLVSTVSERRKLELVKAYIDVERVESAEKLLAELEERYPVYGRPDTVDFELV